MSRADYLNARKNFFADREVRRITYAAYQLIFKAWPNGTVIFGEAIEQLGESKNYMILAEKYRAFSESRDPSTWQFPPLEILLERLQEVISHTIPTQRRATRWIPDFGESPVPAYAKYVRDVLTHVQAITPADRIAEVNQMDRDLPDAITFSQKSERCERIIAFLKTLTPAESAPATVEKGEEVLDLKELQILELLSDQLEHKQIDMGDIATEKPLRPRLQRLADLGMIVYQKNKQGISITASGLSRLTRQPKQKRQKKR